MPEHGRFRRVRLFLRSCRRTFRSNFALVTTMTNSFYAHNDDDINPAAFVRCVRSNAQLRMLCVIYRIVVVIAGRGVGLRDFSFSFLPFISRITRYEKRNNSLTTYFNRRVHCFSVARDAGE